LLHFTSAGITNGALLFTALASTTFTLRFFAGRLVDRFGPRALAVPTAVAQCGGSLLAAHAQTPVAVIVAGVCMGIA
jgi:MFS family permease